jgi:hypothetical protein
MLRQALALMTGLGCLALARPSFAQKATANDRAPSTAKPAPSDTPASVAGISILASAGYGASTAAIGDLDLRPYGTSLGLDAGYTFPFGLRLGAYVTYGLGNQVTETMEGGLRGDRDVVIDTSSVHTGASFGYDVPLDLLILRYTLNTGVTFMMFHFEGASADAMDFEETSSPVIGFHFTPGATLLIKRGRMECGVGFDYFVQANYAIPNGFLGKLMLGVAL